ncbi:hypothetical protein [Xylella taiwanensis]|uniref:Uncharacterized protein n=1 Tax=Xylella taiwanensis TaxID=1444770 RepID=Z9JK41_9GAMM|nr:hypothetical protein AF72_06800 [Xylella taiwanensis]QKD98684.1 hypothetical protein PLS229_07405 [Xylella taiwanensis]
MIFSTGFVPFRRGPIQYIRTVGVDILVERLKALQRRLDWGASSLI